VTRDVDNVVRCIECGAMRSESDPACPCGATTYESILAEPVLLRQKQPLPFYSSQLPKWARTPREAA
jgi:hypothetical protein